MNALAARAVFTVLALLTSGFAAAERADRDKPVILDGGQMTIDETKGLRTLEGDVQLVRGTLLIRTDKLIVTQDANCYQKAIAYGGPGGKARFRQKRDASSEYIDGEAARIEHDGRSDKTEFFGNAYVRSGRDEMRGQYISFDGQTEKYLVTGGTTNSSGHAEPVRAVIVPKSAPAPDSSPGDAQPPSHN
jgi:lipopolysaccharide export system protein LptA